MRYDWYNGTMDVKVDISDVLETLCDYLRHEDVRYIPFEIHGHSYELSIREERDKAFPDAIERAFQRLGSHIANARDHMVLDNKEEVRKEIDAALSLCNMLMNEYWTSWKERA